VATADLKPVNETKLQELKDSLVENLQESIGEVDVGSSSLEEEQLHNIESAALRIRMLFPQMDIRDIFDDDEAGAGLWDTMLAIADRGKLGYKEEVKVCFGFIARASLTLCSSWNMR
jgi:cohesin complex subunit SA-1/2